MLSARIFGVLGLLVLPALAGSNPKPKSMPPDIILDEVSAVKLKLEHLVTLKKPYPRQHKDNLADSITVQCAVAALLGQADLHYDFARSLRNADPLCRHWIDVTIVNKTCAEVLREVLDPEGFTYQFYGDALVLRRIFLKNHDEL